MDSDLRWVGTRDREVIKDTHLPSNRFPGECSHCKAHVGVHEGVIERSGETWTVRHHVGLCTGKRPIFANVVDAEEF